MGGFFLKRRMLLVLVLLLLYDCILEAYFGSYGRYSYIFRGWGERRTVGIYLVGGRMLPLHYIQARAIRKQGAPKEKGPL